MHAKGIVKLNPSNFRIFGHDGKLSNVLGAMFEVTRCSWNAASAARNEFLVPDELVLDSVLSGHHCDGSLQSDPLTRRHGVLSSCEAFIRIVDSMFSQPVKGLKVTETPRYRQP